MRDELKGRVCAAIDAARPQILAWGGQIASRPELGFKEADTSRLVRWVFDSLSIPYESPLALTGVKGRLQGRPVSLRTPCFNVIWQGSANEIALRGLLHADTPAFRLNVTGPETVWVKAAALRLGEILGQKPIFKGPEGTDALLSDASLATEIFGPPRISAAALTEWQGQWLLDGGRGLGKPTHFEERKGAY